MHQLDLTIAKSFNLKTLIIENSSIFDDDKKVDNIILEVLPPGKTCHIAYNIPNRDWCKKVLNCALLKICCIDCPKDLSILPDGIYNIRYSIAPNKKTMVEYNHFRVSSLMANYIKTICTFNSNKSSYSIKDIKLIEKKLFDIKFKIENAVLLIEECNDLDSGKSLYNIVVDELNSINDGNFNKSC